jgi:hypothetical protein
MIRLRGVRSALRRQALRDDQGCAPIALTVVSDRGNVILERSERYDRPPDFSGRGGCWYEVVPIKHQTGREACAIRAGDSVRNFVRAFPWGRRAGGACDPIRPGAVRVFHRSSCCRTRQSVGSAPAAGFRPRFRPATTRRLRDLRRHRAGEHGSICGATAVAAPASRGIPVSDHRRRVRPFELRACRFSASRSPIS